MPTKSVWSPGKAGKGPNLDNGQNMAAKLAYLRQRRDQLAANPVTQTVSDGTTVTQSGTKQQDKIDFLKSQMGSRSPESVDPGFDRMNGPPKSTLPRKGSLGNISQFKGNGPDANQSKHMIAALKQRRRGGPNFRQKG